MRLQYRIALAVGCVSLLAMCLPAFGNPVSGQVVRTFRAGETPPAPMPTRSRAIKPSKAKLASREPDHLSSAPVTEQLKRPPGGWPALVAEARKYMGTNPTSRKKLWCATFMNMVLHKVGYAGTNSDAARSFAYYGHRISSPQVGAIAVLTRGRTGGHVGVVTGVDPHGNPIIISGNHGHRVGEGIYPASRVIAYVMPTESRPLTRVADRTPVSAIAVAHEIDSPIDELIAAIEAEQTKADAAKPQQLPAQQQQPQPQQQPQADAPRAGDTPHDAERQEPHRTVQQTPDSAGAVDASVADVFGLKDRSATPIPPARVPQQPQRQTRQRPGRVAAADIN